MSLKGKNHSANTEEKGGGEARRDDLLWKDLLARFFVPMLHSLLPELARDIDDKRDVVFLVVEAEARGLRLAVRQRHGPLRLVAAEGRVVRLKELRRLARFTRRPEGGEPDENRCKLCVPKFKLCANAFLLL